ncbi:MAG: hypothetical protein AB2563_03305 [Candidatus Thiodiazotropha endolucinida]
MKFLLLISLFVLSACTERVKIDEVKVFNPKFEVIKVLSSKAATEAFEGLWYELKPVEELPFESALNEGLYKIDIVSPNKRARGRWLYHSSGFVVRLGKTLKPRYQVKDVAKFNERIGI